MADDDGPPSPPWSHRLSRLIEELDYRLTPMGPIILRRRWVAAIDQDVVEVILGDEHLMSSLFTVGETELATLGLARADGTGLKVLVGGLGLGYTAQAALSDPRVASVEVADAIEAVIDWHRAGLVPIGESLGANPRCILTHADFFGLFDADPTEDGLWDVILLDIDHSPYRLLNPAHARFYTAGGLTRMKHWLRPGGIFALWSDDAPDAAFLQRLEEVFVDPTARVVPFANPLTGDSSTCTIYVAGA
jgi:spermidine synthase